VDDSHNTKDETLNPPKALAASATRGGFFAGFKALRAECDEKKIASTAPPDAAEKGGWITMRSGALSTAPSSTSGKAIFQEKVLSFGRPGGLLQVPENGPKAQQATATWAEKDREAVVEPAIGDAHPWAAPPSSASADLSAEENRTLSAEGEIIALLVSRDGVNPGEIVPLRRGRWLINGPLGARGAGIITVDHPSVSPFHATLRVDGCGKILFRDQLSDGGTKVLRSCGGVRRAVQTEELQHGDHFVLGERVSSSV
jgi:hypothetical protein